MSDMICRFVGRSVDFLNGFTLNLNTSLTGSQSRPSVLTTSPSSFFSKFSVLARFSTGISSSSAAWLAHHLCSWNPPLASISIMSCWSCFAWPRSSAPASTSST
uniref:(northern house mosquito) hypothetical protein n=1 Tax=Culex pipiens TaxID=7175 RepID=A0A8D8C4E9_CULPI